MSTNIHFRAQREILVIKTGRQEIQHVYFDQWQTPTEVTLRLMRSHDPIAAYRDWILSMGRDEELGLYAEDDPFEEREPVGKMIYNASQDHVDEFDQWICTCQAEGYTVSAEAW